MVYSVSHPFYLMVCCTIFSVASASQAEIMDAIEKDSISERHNL